MIVKLETKQYGYIDNIIDALGLIIGTIKGDWVLYSARNLVKYEYGNPEKYLDTAMQLG